MTMSIQFCGPIPQPGAPAVGGYEACNRRTIDALGAGGDTVHPLHYPTPRGGALAKLKGYVRGYLRLLREIDSSPGEVFHLTGLYKHFAPAEWLLLRRAKRRGLRTIYDIRAGAMFRHYQRLGPAYRWLFRSLLRQADQVMIEGPDYAPFVLEVTGKPAFYLPNHLPVQGMPARSADGAAPLRLVYIGRITLDKGIETALQAARLLAESGQPCTIAIAGSGPVDLLERLQRDYPEAEWLGAISPNRVLEELGKSHFFLFPTRHTGEGHSNALTEAMAMGCVPVAADNGFNRSVIGASGVVLPLQDGARAYASAVRVLWQGGDWAGYSQAASERARTLFSTEQAVARLRGAYRDLLKASA